jgi:hypothetical protein
MKKFNGYSYKGATEADNKAILKYYKKDIELLIDEQDRVWTEGGLYIADAVKTEDGDGIYC